MRRIIVLLLIGALVGAVTPVAAFAGVEPSPFHADVNRLEAVAARMETSAAHVERLLPEDGEGLHPDTAVARQLEAVTKRVDRDLTYAAALLEEIRSEGHSGDFPDALDAATDIRSLVDEIHLRAARAVKHPVYGDQAASLADLTQDASDILGKYLAVELIVDIAHDLVPYDGSQHLDIWVVDGWGNPWEGRAVVVTYFRPDYSFPVFQQDVVPTDANGYRSSSWYPDWADPMVPGATIPLRVGALDAHGDPLPHEQFFFDMESSPTAPGDTLP